jgi:hypothetical protein
VSQDGPDWRLREIQARLQALADELIRLDGILGEFFAAQARPKDLLDTRHLRVVELLEESDDTGSGG